MRHIVSGIIYSGICILLFATCDQPAAINRGTEEMVKLLRKISKENFTPGNDFCSEAKINYYQASFKNTSHFRDSVLIYLQLTHALLEHGDEKQAVEVGEKMVERLKQDFREPPLIALKTLAIAYLRLGERLNCVNDHSAESCIFPIKGSGIQRFTSGTEKAIDIYKEVLQRDPADGESKWLLNVAYMALGRYPNDVPPKLLLKDLGTDTSSLIKPFIDLGVRTGLNTNNMAGGSIIEDFDNDGILDLVTSSWELQQGMHFCKNNGTGSFTDQSESSGLQQLTGGLNIMQTDYNNDGYKDIFVARGAWMRQYGNQPNSLLRNNGDGTFTDVTIKSGLLSFHPTQAATWADFNGDGFLDLFIGNESMRGQAPHPCEFYLNNKNGTFTEMAAAAGCDFTLYVKGVTSGDMDNDGLPDIFISTLDGVKILLKNETQNGVVAFKNVSGKAGFHSNRVRTFATWMFDYDNDGWLDIMVAGYNFEKSLAWYAAQEALKLPDERSGNVFIYRNLQNGRFQDVSTELGLNKVVFAMGANFGDINNDGYPDMYFGTGNPLYQSLVPNKMFLNIDGQRFADITSSARLGNLQKGHGISFADLDYDGDQDIYIEMGGAYTGDAYQNSLYINPGQNDNHWIKISLEGTKANRAAIGAKMKITFAENRNIRSIYREVNSGGSFGSNPLMQHIGIGQAIVIKSIEIKWPGSNTIQEFNDVLADQHIVIKEGSPSIATVKHQRVDFTVSGTGTIGCAPVPFHKH
ncbi:MAG: CRTAC1 family protein [Chitinophagaceae bacterium]|nr:CRTAC1 family protein [Chitinophagaceae bacterium]